MIAISAYMTGYTGVQRYKRYIIVYPVLSLLCAQLLSYFYFSPTFYYLLLLSHLLLPTTALPLSSTYYCSPKGLLFAWHCRDCLDSIESVVLWVEPFKSLVTCTTPCCQCITLSHYTGNVYTIHYTLYRSYIIIKVGIRPPAIACLDYGIIVCIYVSVCLCMFVYVYVCCVYMLRV